MGALAGCESSCAGVRQEKKRVVREEDCGRTNSGPDSSRAFLPSLQMRISALVFLLTGSHNEYVYYCESVT